MQQQVHLREQERERGIFAATQSLALKDFAFLNRAGLRLHMVESSSQKPARAAGGIEHDFAELGIDRLDHETHDGTRRIELSVLTRGVAHLPQQSLIHPTEGLNVLGAIKMDAVDQVDDIPQHIPAGRVIPQVAKHRGDHVAPLAASAIATQTAEEGEQT